MSRAFVKEDGPDNEPLPDLPISPHPNYVTMRGLRALQDRLAAAQAELAALKARLEQAERRIREAEARAATAERALATEALPSRGGGLLRRVHLAETAPTWLVDAARRAFRLRFHPDRFADPVMKARAEETFKEAEETFRQIAANGQ